jgi:hypothetical protein
LASVFLMRSTLRSCRFVSDRLMSAYISVGSSCHSGVPVRARGGIDDNVADSDFQG